MPVLKFLNCDYGCDEKWDKRGNFRVYCHRMDLKCKVEPPITKQSDDIAKERRLKALMSDIRLVITNSKQHGESLSDLIHIFKDYPPLMVRNATMLLIDDGQIKKSPQKQGEDRYISTDPRVVGTSLPSEGQAPFKRGDLVVSSEPGVPKEGEVWEVQYREDTGWHVKLRMGFWWPARYFTLKPETISSASPTFEQRMASAPKNMRELKKAEPNAEFNVQRRKGVVRVYRTYGGPIVGGEGRNTALAIKALYRATYS